MKKYGYIRVSTKDQNPERQFIALQEYGIPKENIYLDQMSGRDFLRPQYQRLMKALRKGDLLVVKSIDRLGRNYEEILEKYYQGDRGTYPGDRYAAAEYGFGPGRPDGGIYFRSGATNSGLCGGDRTGIYQAASGGRDCGGEGEGSPVWLPEDGKPP